MHLSGNFLKGLRTVSGKRKISSSHRVQILTSVNPRFRTETLNDRDTETRSIT